MCHWFPSKVMNWAVERGTGLGTALKHEFPFLCGARFPIKAMELRQAGWGRCHHTVAALGSSEKTLGTSRGSLWVTSRAQPEPLRRPEAGSEVLFGSVCFSPEWQEEAAEASLTRKRRPQPPPARESTYLVRSLRPEKPPERSALVLHGGHSAPKRGCFENTW